MAAEQGKDTRTGEVPALNIKRIYRTTVPADELARALAVVFAPGEGQVSIGLGGHEWVDAAVSGAIGLVAAPPVLLGTAYGIWKENQLDQEVWQVIDERTGVPAAVIP